MLRRALRALKREWLSALGVLFIVLGGTVDLLDQIGTIDIQPLLPVTHAERIVTMIGVLKVFLRLAYAVVGFFLTRNKSKEGC